jgi:nucleoside-diphosphate-sugar epimerase
MIIVTGGSGQAGRACVADLMTHGYDVTSIDIVPPNTANVRFCRADVTDFGEAMAAVSMIDERVEKVTGIVHLAAIRAPGLAPNHVTFATNTISTYNIFEAARQLKIRNIVWASSETVYGVPYPDGPAYVPVDEDIQQPETAYSLSKFVGEQMATQFCRWDKRLKIVGLRFSNIMDPEDYVRFPDFDRDPRLRHWNLWTYIDVRDAAQAIRKSLEAKLRGAIVIGIANADSVMSRSNGELLAAVYPGAKLARPIDDHESLISIDKAQRLLGYRPRYSWRDRPGTGKRRRAAK